MKTKEEYNLGSPPPSGLTKGKIIEVLKKYTQLMRLTKKGELRIGISEKDYNSIASDILALQFSALTDDEIEAIEFINENPDCEKYWLSKVKNFFDLQGNVTDDSREALDEWQEQFEIAINAFLKLVKKV